MRIKINVKPARLGAGLGLVLAGLRAAAQEPPPAPPSGPTITLPAEAEPAPSPPAPSPSELGTGRRAPIGGYGEAFLVRRESDTEATLRRFVLFVGYHFTDWARLYSEIEVEDARELEMEQAYLELLPVRRWGDRFGVRAGLLLVPLGIINLYHEPPTFNGVDRPVVDQLILPTTWREVGVGVFGEPTPGLHLQLYLMSGLNAANFTPAGGIGPGRGQGAEARADDAAVSGRISYNRLLGLDLGAGFYVGGAGQGTAGLGGVTVGILEADLRYARQGLQLRAQYAHIFISNADKITAYQRMTNPTAPAVGSSEQGTYVEAGYDLLHPLHGLPFQQLVAFGRYEYVDTRATLPQVPAAGASEALQFATFGLTYGPHPQIVFKLDYRWSLDEEPQAMPNEAAESQLGFGVGFMF
ncbi:MAG TPA: hypothetical protein VKN99_16785 [Polyangia bacterium]|nr:hypothetical protein [Polyangia bacterium]